MTWRSACFCGHTWESDRSGSPCPSCGSGTAPGPTVAQRVRAQPVMCDQEIEQMLHVATHTEQLIIGWTYGKDGGYQVHTIGAGLREFSRAGMVDYCMMMREAGVTL